MKNLRPVLPEGAEKRLKATPERFRVQRERGLRGELSPRGAIKTFCLECVGWEVAAVRECTSELCPLFQYRPWS